MESIPEEGLSSLLRPILLKIGVFAAFWQPLIASN
jgi:hypothetical protein